MLRSFVDWRDDGQLEVYVEFPSPIAVGREFRFTAELRWPVRCRPLVRDRRPDEFCVTTGPAMDLLEYTVVLPRGREAFYDPVGFGIGEKGLTLVSRTTPEGRTEIFLRAKGLTEGRRIGMWLDLK
jgi:hypothetical protein